MKRFLLPLIYTHPAAAGLFLATCLFWLVPEMASMACRLGTMVKREASIQDGGPWNFV